MTTLLSATPPLRGCAIIVVQHLDPKGESHLVELLAKHTSLTVQPAADGTKVQSDHVYVCVPNRDVVVSEGHLRLLDPETERSHRRPIDRLFDSLASDYGERAIAIILSGAASDGSRGISAIKAAGGMVMVQDPDTAKFDSMPRNAVNTGLTDLVLPIDQMPNILERLAKRMNAARTTTEVGCDTDEHAGAPVPVVEPSTLKNIINVLDQQFDYDFTDYKRPTLLRRTQRRMSLRNVSGFEEYAKLVREDDKEAAALFRDLMINVSCFFRDREAWEVLAREVIDPLIALRESGDDMRVWTAGCATGEEAYTIGMMLLERIEASGKRITPQIFATDVSDSLDVARAGVYPSAIAEQLSEERLKRFFVKQEATYAVKSFLRDMIVFARHNVISDPPFSRMDLIVCRNMLIYIEPDTQRKILWIFNFALRDGGTLFLGSAETIGMQGELFEPISAPWRIFRSRRIAHAGRFDFPRFSVADQRPGPRGRPRTHQPVKDELLGLAQRSLLDRYAPPSVVTDADHQVIVYQGDTSRYLSQPGGEPTRDLLSLVPPGLRPGLRHALQEAIEKECHAVSSGGYIKENDERRPVTITVTPIGPSRDNPTKLLVSFEEPLLSPVNGIQSIASNADSGNQTIDQLEEELRLTRRDLHDVSEQYDRLIEEYSTSNEEMLSINEELQSANEELETSKEELQSLNEELNTLNNELRNKVDAVEQTNNDLSNLLASTEIATIFLDFEFRIRWFTPAMKSVFRLIPSDVGRPIRDLASSITGSDLELDAQTVLGSLTPLETEVVSQDKSVFIRRVMPYRTADHRINGIVATFIDITEHKRAERLRERLMHELSHRIKNTLATVQAIVQGLGRKCDSLPAFLEAFEPRLAALARAHALLTMPGAERIAMKHLLRRELRPYLADDSDRVTVDGEGLTLRRESAIAMELIFHELVTNALKYGSLSNDTGVVHVRWESIPGENERRMRINWTESGGPTIEPPNINGFGSTLIQNCVEHDLDGSVTMLFKPTGLNCTIEFPTSKEEVDEN